jgi:hypothetical protein
MKALRPWWAAAAIVGGLLASNGASAVLITFDDLPGMANSPGSLVPGPSRLSDQYLSQGVRFSSGAGFVAVVDLTSSGPNHTHSNPNGIGGVSAAGTLSYGTPIEMSFFDAVTGTAGVTDFVSIRGDRIPIAGTATLTAFGFDGSSLGSVTANDDPVGLTLSLALSGIHRLVLTETSATIAFDNLTFNAPIRVPEPTTVLLLAFGVLGLLARNRARARQS